MPQLPASSVFTRRRVAAVAGSALLCPIVLGLASSSAFAATVDNVPSPASSLSAIANTTNVAVDSNASTPNVILHKALLVDLDHSVENKVSVAIPQGFVLVQDENTNLNGGVYDVVANTVTWDTTPNVVSADVTNAVDYNAFVASLRVHQTQLETDDESFFLAVRGTVAEVVDPTVPVAPVTDAPSATPTDAPVPTDGSTTAPVAPVTNAPAPSAPVTVAPVVPDTNVVLTPGTAVVTDAPKPVEIVTVPVADNAVVLAPAVVQTQVSSDVVTPAPSATPSASSSLTPPVEVHSYVIAAPAASSNEGDQSVSSGEVPQNLVKTPSPSATVAPAPTPTATLSTDKTCNDFKFQEEAQDYIKSNPAASSSLDADSDGVACESLPAQFKSGTGAAGPTSTTPDKLAYTGAESTPILILGGGLVLAGAGAMFATRRRPVAQVA